MKNKSWKTLIPLFLLLISLMAGSCKQEQKQQPVDSEVPEVIDQQFSLSVNWGDSTDLFSDLPYTQGMTVYEAMEVADELSGDHFSVEYASFPGMGKFVEAINGVAQQPDDKIYWQYCVDDTMATKGVEDYELKPGQQIQWHLGEQTPCAGVGD